jgi:hypothetical protein
MNHEPNSNPNRLDNVLCFLVVAAGVGFAAYAALATFVAPLTA